jgi:hypothetical protein
LKKRSKKLLFSGHGPDAWRPWPESKSLLLLFFRKEVLSAAEAVAHKPPIKK